ncbi:N-acetylmuramate alpha-1-phosphate uridylyltransferase MurU [Inmirania thermothiophila]|uniref:MurNAc alpha-1-phosphate uridylyltransferase n=1 Tax=Inmirania thermothiophila TaxID=1750597 RepID=A0A3N1Y778_9GAMM|nr:nucleotidyltransferase family protein [Inmirania thermothiophila]ROR34674.1 MurNAc alpha-1-phosphate uridylyltransferase [Inmirania thermothiophila]
MRALILAAGRGERLRPLTDRTPKALLEVGGRALIEHHLVRLAAAGIREVAVNLGHLGERIRARLGDGRRHGVRITYFPEAPVLETAGAVVNALAWLGRGPFLVLNADVYTDLDPGRLRIPAWADAHLVLVPNPAHHPAGDFAIDAQGRVGGPGPRRTFAGIGLYRAALFAGCAPGPRPLGPLLREAAAAGRVSGVLHRGCWLDVGTPERLAEARRLAAALEGAHG